MTKKIKVNIDRNKNGVRIIFDEGCIFFDTIIGENYISPYDDFAVWALIPMAMRQGIDIHINGNVHTNTIKNAIKYSYIWNIWSPEKMHKINVTANITRNSNKEASKYNTSLLTLSGGIDSTYSLIKHKEDRNISHTITAIGFDYPLHEERAISGIIEKVQKISSYKNANCIVIKTNIRDYIDNWEWFFSTAISALLHTRYGIFKSLMNARDQTCYYAKFMPLWGMNFCTEYLFSIFPDTIKFLDGDIERPQKIYRIAEEEIPAKYITVCWKNTTHSDNCEKCHKCIYTKILTLLITGKATPIFKDNYISKHDLKKLKRDFKIGFKTEKNEILYLKNALNNAKETKHNKTLIEEIKNLVFEFERKKKKIELISMIAEKYIYRYMS